MAGLNYTQPKFSGVSGLRQPVALQSDFFKNNSWENPYTDVANQAGTYGRQFLDRRLATDPLGKGGVASSPSAFQSNFGFERYDPNDWRIGAGMSNLVGGTKNLMDQYARQTANAGIAAGRSGMGVRGMGAAGMPSQIALQGTRDIAGDYANRYGKAVDWTMQGINQANTAANAYANMYGDIYKTDVGAGTNLLNQQLQAIGMGDQSRNQWANMQLGAQAADANALNQGWTNQRQWDLEQQDRNRQADQYDAQRGQQQRLQQLLQQATLQHSGGTPLNSGLVEYLRQMGMLPSTAGNAGKGNSWMQGIRGF